MNKRRKSKKTSESLLSSLGKAKSAFSSKKKRIPPVWQKHRERAKERGELDLWRLKREEKKSLTQRLEKSPQQV